MYIEENDDLINRKLSVFSSIIGHVNELSDKISKIGRQIVFAIIAGVWTLSYSNNVFSPSDLIIWSIALAFLYLFLDLVYYIVRMWQFNSYTKKLHIAPRKEYDKKQFDVFKAEHIWRLFSLCFTTFKILILIGSAILIFIHIITM